MEFFPPCVEPILMHSSPVQQPGIRGAFIMITILPFVGQHPRIVGLVFVGIPSLFFLFSSRIIDVGGRFVCCISWKATTHAHYSSDRCTHIKMPWRGMQECSLCACLLLLHLFIFLQPPACSSSSSSSEHDDDSCREGYHLSRSGLPSWKFFGSVLFPSFNPSLL